LTVEQEINEKLSTRKNSQNSPGVVNCKTENQALWFEQEEKSLFYFTYFPKNTAY